MNTFLIHTDSIGGHQLEYLHHLYVGALRRPKDLFVFVVPNRFENDSRNLDWTHSDNIIVDIMGDDEVPPDHCSLFRKGWINSKTVRRYCKKYKATDVVTISIMGYLPFLPFLVRNVRLSGIVYRIYLYEWKEESRVKRIQDVIKFLILSRCKVFYKVYICNDPLSAQSFNRLFHTDKFMYLPDPIGSLDRYKGKNLRRELGISDDKIVLLHPGSLNNYKNTLGILEAIDLLDKNDCRDIVVVFAGQIQNDIKTRFCELYSKLESKIQFVLYEGYISFELMADLFTTCNFVLIPYSVKGQSSGIVGHAAYYRKPVIAVKGGLIGRIVKNWKLGYLLRDSTPDSISSFLSNISKISICDSTDNTYVKDHEVESFIKVIYGN